MGHLLKVFSTWRPLHAPLDDWPLAICDGSSVNFDADTTTADIVYPNWVTENVQVYFHEAQRWYWLPKQMPTEVLVFTSAQSNHNKLEGKVSARC